MIKVHKTRYDQNSFICWFWLNGIMYSTLLYLEQISVKNFDSDLINSYRNTGGLSNGI
jgi:hypothetical protein